MKNNKTMIADEYMEDTVEDGNGITEPTISDMLITSNHYNIHSPYYEEYSGYGPTQLEAIRDLIFQLKYKNLYDFYRYSAPCTQHGMIPHMIIYFIGGGLSYVTFGYKNNVWSSSVRIVSKTSL